MTYQELRTMSLSFRRVSSNFLNATTDNANVVLARFKKFIDDTPFIAELLTKEITGVDYEFKECFKIDGQDWNEIDPPVDESCHIKAQYDYITYLCENKTDVLSAALGYCHASGTTYGNIIREFIDASFKPLIDYINDAISEQMIVEEETKMTAPAMAQSIGTVNGMVIQQGSGSITATNTTGTDASAILNLIEKIIPSLSAISDASQDDIDSIKDDLESVEEQLKSPSPKKSRLQKALDGIKKFASDFSMKLAVTLAAGAVTGTDWNTLIQSIEQFISGLVH
ncbi:MAG: hypothetical protein PHV32_04455 [Eubacteriales bacterium]|nr:hypothetical protein [Eubacteriales bacterium]